MGGETFVNYKRGKTAQEAFRLAVDDAAYEHGHGGYTGTIAEKSEFRMIETPTGIAPKDFVRRVMSWRDEDGADNISKAVLKARENIDDKWGPAGCVDLKDGEFAFFGWASS